MKSLLLFISLLQILLFAQAEPNSDEPVIRIKGHAPTRYISKKPTININDVTVAESEGNAVLTVSLSQISNTPIEVYYKTQDGTAKHPKDYQKVKGQLVIPAGSLSTTISIRIIKDNDPEPSEYFFVELSLKKKEQDAVLGRATAQVTLVGGTTSYLELNNLLVVYKHTNGGNIPDNYTNKLDSALKAVSSFYWRHSHMGLNIKWTIYVIDDYLDRVHEQYNYIYPGEVESDLRSRGFTDNSFDAVVAIARGSGAYSYGAKVILGKGAYTQVPWPEDWWEDALLYPWYWFIIHEFHHAIDAMFSFSGHPEYPHNHPGTARVLNEYIPHSGTGWDLNAQILQTWDRRFWFDLNQKGVWGTIRTSADNDLDTIPDKDSNTPLDEERFGSNPLKKDSDKDGLNDLPEAMAAIFSTTNPRIWDSDNDGIPDGTDSAPIYPLNTTVPFQSNLTVAQALSEWPLAGHYFFNKPESNLSSLHLAYSENQLYIGVKIPTGLKQFEVLIDANNDGYFYGKDNIEVKMNVNTIDKVTLYDAASVPAGDYRDFIESTLPVTGFLAASKTDESGSTYQLIIPKLSQYGLNLAAGEKIGIQIKIPGYGYLLEPDDLLTVTLGDRTNCNTNAETNKVTREVIKENKIDKEPLKATAYPNPTSNAFILQWTGRQQPVSISINDVLGRVVERRTGLPANGTLQLGNYLRPGTYYAELFQGNEKVIIKLVKKE